MKTYLIFRFLDILRGEDQKNNPNERHKEDPYGGKRRCATESHPESGMHTVVASICCCFVVMLRVLLLLRCHSDVTYMSLTNKGVCLKFKAV